MIEDNLLSITGRIKTAALKSGRSPDEIKLVAVSKRVAPERIMQAVECGHTVFGENYIQEASGKIPGIRKQFPDRSLQFHFIGKLQSNKAKKAAGVFDVIETVDSVKLADILEKQLGTLGKSIDAFLQVNIGAEKQKSGVMPEDCETILGDMRHLNLLKIKGLMTMPPFLPDPEDVRPYFRQLRKLSQKLKNRGLLGQHGPVELSMGMSGDFEVAVEEGATVVRIGTAIFGQRLT